MMGLRYTIGCDFMTVFPYFFDESAKKSKFSEEKENGLKNQLTDSLCIHERRRRFRESGSRFCLFD
jgi:hypothetical protein